MRAERISELIRYLETFFEGQHVPVAIFGHIGNGNAHITPLLDVNDRRDFDKMGRPTMRSIRPSCPASTDRSAASMAMGGCAPNMSEDVRRGTYQLFVEVKRTIDPANVMNPASRSATRRSPTISTTNGCPSPARPAPAQFRLPGLRCVSVGR